MRKLRIEDIYKAFNLRFDVREARKLLDLPKTAHKTKVNRELRALYHQSKEDAYQPIYSYTLTGLSHLTENGVVKVQTSTPISVSFQSKTAYTIKKGSLNVDNQAIIDEWQKQGKGYADQKLNMITHISRRKIPKHKKKLKDIPLYNRVVNLPYTQFNGFRDTGKMMCVPETLLHHLKLNERNKKLTLDKVIIRLEDAYIMRTMIDVDDDDDDDNAVVYI